MGEGNIGKDIIQRKIMTKTKITEEIFGEAIKKLLTKTKIAGVDSDVVYIGKRVEAGGITFRIVDLWHSINKKTAIEIVADGQGWTSIAILDE